MTKYQLIVLFLLVVSVLSTLFEYMGGSNKGLLNQLHKLFTALTLLAVLLIGYRAFYLIR